MRILLSGGTGLIGQALCRHWQTQGHQLVVWSRKPQQVPALCSGAQGIARLNDIDGAIDAVVNLAGAPIADRPWTPARRKLLWESRVDLTRQLIDALRRWPVKPRVLISGSATGWYGDRGDQRLTEASPAGQGDFGSELCIAWENEALTAQELDIRVVLLRTSPVLSPQGGVLARLRLPFSLGLGGRLGDGRQWMPWIHLDDAVGLIDDALNNASYQGPVNLCAPQLVRNAEFTRSLASALRRPAFLHVPGPILRLGLGQMSVLLLGGQRAEPRRALDNGYPFRHPAIAPALANLLGDRA